ncbi:MAG: YlxR family protein [Lachnospiraceae bacterium]|nr:YlxR family protein [Lachnospiraceae bacterium]
MSTIKKQPQRLCIGCQEMKDKKDLLRVVCTPEGEIELDPTGKKNGRGAYICKNASCLEKAMKTKGLHKAFKREISTQTYNRLIEEIGTLETK